MEKIIIMMLIIAIIITATLAFIVNENRTESNKVNVRLEWLHQAQFAGFYVAEQKDYYKENGINVNLNMGGVDYPAIQMVAGGKEQFGLAEADQILLAREKGVPIVAIATLYRKNPTVWFSLKKSNITSAEEFVGKRIGTWPDVMALLNVMLKNAGVKKENISEVPIKYDISPLLIGEVDVLPGYVINEPIVAQEKGYDVNIIWPADYNIKFYSMTLFTTENMIKNNPELVQQFVNSTLKGWNYAYDNPDEAVNYTLMYSNQLNREHESKMIYASLELLKPDDKPIGYMDKIVWENMQKILLDNKDMKNPINNINEVYTNKFLENYYHGINN
ncbi:MAG: ABC transporter substrate-binding protein [Nanoarchaeota archaeon]|nr:ABC transporter substrate-binding protein [Nanoarchaeota archaeon]